MSVLSPIDLLSLNPEEQNVLRCLAKSPRQVPAHIAAHTGMQLEVVEQTLAGLVKNARIVEQLHEGERVYSARFQFKSRQVRNMPDIIQNIYQRNTENLLVDVPLLAGLSSEEREKLYALGERRALVPEEVLFWQGHKVDIVGIVQNGLLKLTEIQGQGTGQQGYLRRTDWIGLEEAFGDYLTLATCTAVIETTVHLWSKTVFFQFINQHGAVLSHINNHFLQKLRECETAKNKGQGKLWVIDGIGSKVGATSIAASIAAVAQKNLNGDGLSHVLFWPNQKEDTLTASLSEAEDVSRLAQIMRHPAGYHILTHLEANNYPPKMRLDMVLNTLLRRYEYIVCDVGDNEDEFYLNLRGNAHTLITLTTSEEQIQAGWDRWQKLRPFAVPGQKKILALNKAQSQGIQVDSRFHLVIPEDWQGINHILNAESRNIDSSRNVFIQAIEEVFRRLSLTHSLAIFVPSTLAVDQTVDNSYQVHAALSFLGDIFGGATSSDAEGVWRSEDSGLVTEQVTVVRTFVSKKALNSNLDNVLGFASQLKKEMKQEAVAVSVDNQMILV